VIICNKEEAFFVDVNADITVASYFLFHHLLCIFTT
jgi:hypothetical protein